MPWHIFQLFQDAGHMCFRYRQVSRVCGTLLLLGIGSSTRLDIDDFLMVEAKILRQATD